MLAFLLLAACPAGERLPTEFHSEPPSAFNGVWTADGTTRPVGAIVFETPAGTKWSPHGFVLARAGAYLTHDCRDFRVDPTAGTVAGAVTSTPMGSVSDAGLLTWDDTPVNVDLRTSLAGAQPSNPRADFSATGVALDAGIQLLAADTLALDLQLVWGTPDGGFVIDAERLTLHRRTACP